MNNHFYKVIYVVIVVSVSFMGCSKEISTELEYKVIKEFTLDDETQEHLHRMYTSVSSSP